MYIWVLFFVRILFMAMNARFIAMPTERLQQYPFLFATVGIVLRLQELVDSCAVVHEMKVFVCLQFIEHDTILVFKFSVVFHRATYTCFDFGPVSWTICSSSSNDQWTRFFLFKKCALSRHITRSKSRSFKVNFLGTLKAWSDL